MGAGGKYTDNDRCDWCGESPVQSYVVQTNGVKTKRYKIAAVACHACAVRLELIEDADANSSRGGQRGTG